MQHSRIHRLENSIIKNPYTIYPYNIILPTYTYMPHQQVLFVCRFGGVLLSLTEKNRFICIFIAVLDLTMAKIR